MLPQLGVSSNTTARPEVIGLRFGFVLDKN